MSVLVVDDSYTGYYLRVYFVHLLAGIPAIFALSQNGIHLCCQPCKQTKPEPDAN